MEKYIFLDFDGVLNTPKGKFDQKAIGKLRRLLERCDAYRAEELAKILKSHVEYGTPLEAMDTVIDRLWLSGDY
jgi:hypothetical protein